MRIETLFTTPEAPRASALQTLFDNRVPAPPAPAKSEPLKASTTGYPSYAGAGLSRLNADWIGTLLSSDQEVRNSLKRLRARCRQLHNNNDYAMRFVNLVKRNAVGPNGIQLEAQLQADQDELAEQVNDELERGWRKWCRKGNPTADGKLSWVDVQNLVWESLIVDGEVFLRKIVGFPDNDFGFTLQFIDPDQVDVQFNRPRKVDSARGTVQNEVRMGIEVNEWLRPIAYWVLDGHPAEGHVKRTAIPASDMIHIHMFRRGNQTRGVPWLVTAMSRMNMLGGYEEAELTSARVGACQGGFFVSKTGEEYTGRKNKDDGSVEVSMEPGLFEQLPEGVDFKPFTPQHPNAAFPEFVKAMVRGMAVGLDISYPSLAGDLREVNFSSIRQAVLEEREMYRTLQTFAKDHLNQPVYEAWVPAAIPRKQLALPAAGIDEYVDPENLRWVGRGWTWVDPLKDVQAGKEARGSGQTTLAKLCAAQGEDWRDVIDQIAIEDDYAEKKGVILNFAVTKSADGLPAVTPDPSAPPVPVKDGDEEGENQ
ncbi:phage portal protein, lambda [Candidatus Koribacter versatilis Ellin345]|uniref:Phage portal protein, lambda n=1 Tax=Koribacter versatilis (strain Ellin345) TaxID=204669 RepID=Q1ILS5_KORVE|nr:phage portal protein [Candidatus Koribacter versatilis]ABF42175.1 phage portal protein, lambda [Candidatus Koribacter versatilis Ellin345]